MKVALCLSGQARFGVDNYQHIYENLIAPTNADVFCHFWSTTDPEQDMDPYATAKIYGAKKAIIEDPKVVEDSWLLKWDEKFTDVDLWKYRRMVSMYDSMGTSVSLAWPSYDLLIKARTDLILKKPFDMEEYSSKACYFYDDRVVEDGTLRLYGDELFWGPYREMLDLVFGVKLNLDDMIRKTRQPRPEVMLSQKASEMKTKVSKIGQPNIRRNEILHTERLKYIHSGQAPINDE